MRGLWLNLIVQDKQRMPKSRGESITYAAAFADISRTGQINAQNIWHSTPCGVWWFFYTCMNWQQLA
jgi:hypothetical protein